MAGIDDVGPVVRKIAPPCEPRLADAFTAAYLELAHTYDLPDSGRLASAVASQMELGLRRRPRETTVRVSNPAGDAPREVSGHTVVEIVTDDMPFVVDSVCEALIRRGTDLHALLHPVLRVQRDHEGRLIAVDAPVTPRVESDTGIAEAYLYVEIDRETEPARLDAICAELESVLADVRVAVDDWAAMREHATEIADALRASPPPTVDQEDVGEAAEYIDWLADDHFTFIGYCEYDLVGESDDLSIRLRPDSRLGVVRRRDLGAESATFAGMAPESKRLAAEPWVLTLTRAARSTVHRAVPLDYVGIKEFDASGRVVGERRFTGLYTADVFTEPTERLPVVRQKVATILRRSRVTPGSHDARALEQVIETYPRAELFRLPVDELATIVEGIARLSVRRRVALFVSRDVFGRFVACLVYLPRDRYTTDVRVAMLETLRDAFHGSSVDFTVLVNESVQARLHVVVETSDPLAAVDLDALEHALSEIVRSWRDEFRDALVEAHGEEAGLAAARTSAEVFPPVYQAEVRPEEAVDDLGVLLQLPPGDGLEVGISRSPGEERIRLYGSGSAIALSQVMPMLEHAGLDVLDERPYEVTMPGGERRWISTFAARTAPDGLLADPSTRDRLADLLRSVWRGTVEDDGLNALVLRAGLATRDVVILRALVKYLHQAGVRFTERYVAETLATHAEVTAQLVDLFRLRFDPAHHADPLAPDPSSADVAAAEITAALDGVAVLDEDRILRSLLQVVQAAVRTNAYQRESTGARWDHVSVKLDATRLPFLPAPVPEHEVWVYAPRVEGVHLRAGDVARGGIRWSDRREDFRTEILGLMKAQTVKNAVIVPVGAKGGFVAKQLPVGGDRASLQAEVLESYCTFIRGLLDLTDNLVDGATVAPPDVVRYDGNDAYLVVAADKGTGSFSDHANAIAIERGFWLGDAFASGGSTGYDHKALGITARGAWMSVRAHFRSLGVDADSAPLRVVGIGDMSGDVFGNGLLQSPHVQLVAAFDHRHVFVDPDPDPVASFAERRRLFELPASSWADYDAALLSAGGGVYPRDAKSVPLTLAARQALGVESESVTPDELVRAVLAAPVDLLWNGGIGTFVKASTESQLDVGDRTNDNARVDATALRCSVVAEGGNLGFTQRARVEFAMAGGHIFTDAIDNSAGVDCSDHEVNLKILLRESVASGARTVEERDALLASMTDEVAELVLADNEAQANALELAVADAPLLLGMHARQIERLERSGGLDRALEALPGAKAIQERHALGLGLTAPELAVLLAYAKLGTQRALVASDVPDDPALVAVLAAYFPSAVRETESAAIASHPLRRQIVATVVANSVVNRAGISFLSRFGDETGADLPRLARAHIVARDVFDVTQWWEAIDALDLVAPAAVQNELFFAARRLVERSARWLVHQHDDLAIAPAIARYHDGAARVAAELPALGGRTVNDRVGAERARLAELGVPANLAARAAAAEWLPPVFDIATLAEQHGEPIVDVAAVWFELGDLLKLVELREQIGALARSDRWQAEARAALRDSFSQCYREVVADVLGGTEPNTSAAARVGTWAREHAPAISRYHEVIEEIEATGVFDLTSLTVARRELCSLTGDL